MWLVILLALLSMFCCSRNLHIISPTPSLCLCCKFCVECIHIFVCCLLNLYTVPNLSCRSFYDERNLHIISHNTQLESTKFAALSTMLKLFQSTMLKLLQLLLKNYSMRNQVENWARQNVETFAIAVEELFDAKSGGEFAGQNVNFPSSILVQKTATSFCSLCTFKNTNCC